MQILPYDFYRFSCSNFYDLLTPLSFRLSPGPDDDR